MNNATTCITFQFYYSPNTCVKAPNEHTALTQTGSFFSNHQTPDISGIVLQCQHLLSDDLKSS